MIITVFSDTHGKHNKVTPFLPGGNLLCCAGDITSMGYPHEIRNFCKWFDKQTAIYDHVVFIAGNHDLGFEDNPKEIMAIIDQYPNINYLQDDFLLIDYEHDDRYENMVRIWGAPWQPEFNNWGFNLPRGGEELKYVWDQILSDTDILITHGPAMGTLDVSGPPWNQPDLGCEILRDRITEIKPKIHIFGHIHGGYGYVFKDGTHRFGTAVLDERYQFIKQPITFNWNKDTNDIDIISSGRINI